MSELQEKDKKYVWHPFTQHLNSEDSLEIVRAEGVYLFAADSKKYIDSNSSWWVNVHGHGHPHLGKAISAQFHEIDHVVFADVTHPKAVELAERITNVLPAKLEKVFFSDNGSTAVEVALKMVIQYWHNKGEDKRRFLALNGAYHGDTFGAMSVGQRGYFNKPFEPFFFEVDYIDFPTEENEMTILKRLEESLSYGEFAGMIVEPLVQGASGMRMYSAALLDKLTAIAQKNDVLVIFDEVMTGFGRTGKLFAMDHCEIKPDIGAFSKGLTGGVMPMGLTVASDKIYNAFLGEEKAMALLHGHSFTANPLACAVACASLDLFEERETWVAIEHICEWNEEFAVELGEYTNVKNIRQQGTIIAFDVETGAADTYFSDIRTKAYQHFLSDGILLRPLGNTIFVNAPYCITLFDYKKICKSILDFLNKL